MEPWWVSASLVMDGTRPPSCYCGGTGRELDVEPESGFPSLQNSFTRVSCPSLPELWVSGEVSGALAVAAESSILPVLEVGTSQLESSGWLLPVAALSLCVGGFGVTTCSFLFQPLYAAGLSMIPLSTFCSRPESHRPRDHCELALR